MDRALRLTASILFVLGTLVALIFVGGVIAGLAQGRGDAVVEGIFCWLPGACALLGPAIWIRATYGTQSNYDRMLAGALNAYQSQHGRINVTELAGEYDMPLAKTIETIQAAKKQGLLPPDAEIDYGAPAARARTPEI